MKSAISIKLKSLVISSTPSIIDDVKHNISQSVLEEMLTLLDSIEAATDPMPNVSYCEVAASFDMIRHTLPMYEVNEYDDWILGELKHLVGALSRVLVHIRYHTPMFTCMGNILKHIVQYINDIADQLKALEADPLTTLEPLDCMWLYKAYQVEEAMTLQGNAIHLKDCGTLNTCIQKFNTMCEAQLCTTWEPLSNSKELICKQNARKKYALENYKALALKDIRDDMMNGDHQGKWRMIDCSKLLFVHPKFGNRFT